MSDVVIVGAGVTGASIAYHLALRGASVTLIDRSAIPAAPSASWASAGGLRSQGRHAVEQPLTKMAAARWPMLSEELNADLEITRGGHLHLAETESEALVVEARLAADVHAGIAIERVGGAGLRELVPGLAASAILGAWTPGDGQANPARVAQAFAAAAVRHGARLHTGHAVAPVMDGNRLIAIESADSARFVADQFVFATGAWSVATLRRLGLQLPLRWRALQMLSSDTATSSLAPTLTAVGRNLSLKQTPDRRYMVGGRWIAAGGGDVPSAEPVDALIAAQWTGAVGLLPALGAQNVERAWAGAEAQTIDHLPLIGPSFINGLYLATGFSNHGFQISPAVGELVAADLTASGQALLAPFRPDRFGTEHTDAAWQDFLDAETPARS